MQYEQNIEGIEKLVEKIKSLGLDKSEAREAFQRKKEEVEELTKNLKIIEKSQALKMKSKHLEIEHFRSTNAKLLKQIEHQTVVMEEQQDMIEKQLEIEETLEVQRQQVRSKYSHDLDTMKMKYEEELYHQRLLMLEEQVRLREENSSGNDAVKDIRIEEVAPDSKISENIVVHFDGRGSGDNHNARIKKDIAIDAVDF